jgi:hypothetical protein
VLGHLRDNSHGSYIEKLALDLSLCKDLDEEYKKYIVESKKVR